MNYLAVEAVAEKNKWLRRVHRLSSFGLMHQGLVPMMWPALPGSPFWQWARRQEREGALWERDVANSDADYLRILALLHGCDVIHRVGETASVCVGGAARRQAIRVAGVVLRVLGHCCCC